MQQIITKEGYEKLKAELEYLRMTKKTEVARRIHDAVENGGTDLLENGELEIARNEMSFVDGRIDYITSYLSGVKILDAPNSTNHNTVYEGMTVKILAEDEEEYEIYSIVGSAEADPVNNRISNHSPLGRALIGRKVGDSVKVLSPNGVYSVTIVEVC